MQISSKTIYKSILGQIIHLSLAVQIENRVNNAKAKEIARNMLREGIDDTLGITSSNKYLDDLDKLIAIYKEEGKDTLPLLQAKQVYRDSLNEKS